MPESKHTMLLLPVPRRTERIAGSFPLRGRQVIRLLAPEAGELLAAGKPVQRGAREVAGLEWSIVAGRGGPDEGVAVTIAIDRAVEKAEGYRLLVDGKGVTITAHDPAGAFYGVQTLVQLMRQSPGGLPCVRIEDWPDFPARGVMLDISRDKVPTMATLYALVDQLAEWKINQLQLYTEHTFAYRAHPQVWAQASPMTGEEILELDRYCRERFMELVPNQNSFGHMERWLKYPRYAPLAEAPNGFHWPWGGGMDTGFTICPLDPGSIKLIEGMYDELLPHFSSGLFNVGCDETFDLGEVRSKAECEKRGKESVYFEFLLKIHKLVRERGRRMQFWGDIILHKPELIPELPKDIIALEWGYDAGHKFDERCGKFAASGVPFYVCPGTSTWLTFAGRTDNTIANLRSAAENGHKHGAIGYLNTDWGDHGHTQYLPASYLGFAVGAAESWCRESNRELPVAEALDLHVFRDSAGVMGKLAYDLGNVYQLIGRTQNNSSVLFWLLTGPADDAKVMEKVTPETIERTEAGITAAMMNIDAARMDRPDAALVADEFRNSAAMLMAACKRARWRLDQSKENAGDLAAELRRIVGEHRRLWLARNREGGLQDSTGRFDRPIGEYSA